MADYKVQMALKDKEITTDNGTFIVYKVGFEGVDGAAELMQKPETPAPKAGDVLTGTITEDPKWGKKFKKDRPGGFGGGGYKRDDNAIRAQWAIGQAMNAYNANHKPETTLHIDGVEELAKKLYDMVDRVKGAAPGNEGSSTPQSVQGQATNESRSPAPAPTNDNQPPIENYDEPF